MAYRNILLETSEVGGQFKMPTPNDEDIILQDGSQELDASCSEQSVQEVHSTQIDNEHNIYTGLDSSCGMEESMIAIRRPLGPVADAMPAQIQASSSVTGTQNKYPFATLRDLRCSGSRPNAYSVATENVIDAALDETTVATKGSGSKSEGTK